MPASKRKTDREPAARRGRPRAAGRDTEDQGHDQDGDQPEPPTPDAPGEPVPAVPVPRDEHPGAYSPVLPPLGEAIAEAREADAQACAEQLARPSAGLADIRRHLAKLTAALEKLQRRGND